MGKSWIEKRDSDKKHQVKINPKSWADMPAGIIMLIPTPKIVDRHVNQIPIGNFKQVIELRKEMANDYSANMSCPMVTGICLRIVSEASYEGYQINQDIKAITPFWRVVEPDSKLAGKLACGIDFIIKKQIQEGIEL
tara:strand:+ start:1038 stop:1448 length:411 start_codon:yes stop_codon:yes gene_type:complete